MAASVGGTYLVVTSKSEFHVFWPAWGHSFACEERRRGAKGALPFGEMERR